MDTKWKDLQAIKKRHNSLKEKIQQWKKNIFSAQSTGTPGGRENLDVKEEDPDFKKIEMKLVEILCDLNFPIDFPTIVGLASNFTDKQSVKDLLIKFSLRKLIELNEYVSSNDEKTWFVRSVDYDALRLLKEDHEETEKCLTKVEENSESEENIAEEDASSHNQDGDSRDEEMDESSSKKNIRLEESPKDSVECILSLQSTKEKEDKKISEEIHELLSKRTARERSLNEQFRSANGQVKEYCSHGTREECMRVNHCDEPCAKLHFLRIIQKHTDESLGDCSFLNTCFHMDSCKYVHYRVEEIKDSHNSNRNPDSDSSTIATTNNIVKTLAEATEQPFKRVLFPPQWIRCDLRFFDMSILGKFAVVMADPPWDIHMELPYGTMSDDEMRNLNIPCLQDEGLIFLWVTGRAMELGRECLKLWGYERCDELVWVKTNQLQRIIRTGRTGHWINHGKEHCLVGVKGNPKNINRSLDCDVIVAEVRATSHKPDEIYGIIERLSPGTRKIELFGRQHNTQPNWVTLGNQLNCVRLVDPQLIEAYKKKYPGEATLMLNTDE